MSGLIPPALLDQIRGSSDIVEVIGGYIPLKRNGANFTALCPFHKEKSPSFNVNPSRQIFHCFGCHKGGDVFTFVKEYENISFIEAVRRLAERANIPIETVDDPKAGQVRHLKEALLQLHDQIARRWQSALANDAGGQIARDYLKKRGVSQEAIELFRLGYAPDAWDDTVNFAKSKGFDTELAEQSGLIIRKEGTDRHYDRFRGRLMFPICDEQGRVIAFSGRVLSGDEKTAKYVNSPETPIFSKGRVFFGLDKSKRALVDDGYAIICEGQLDLIACYMSGVKNVVAPQGTAFTAEHARILKRYVDEVVLCFDSDNAGQNAAVRVLDSLLASGLAIRVATVPAPHDPDSFIKEHGGEAYRKLVESAPGFFDYYLNRLCATNDVKTDKGRQTVVRDMAEAVLKTGSAVTVDAFAQKTALMIAVATESVRSEFKKLERARRTDARNEVPEEVDEMVAAVPPGSLERWLVKLIFQEDSLLVWTMDHLDPEWVEHPVVRKLIQIVAMVCSEGRWQGVPQLLAECDDPAVGNLVTSEIAEARPFPNPAQQLQDIVLRIRNRHLDTRIAEMGRQAGLPSVDDGQRAEMLHERQALKMRKAEPLQPIHP